MDHYPFPAKFAWALVTGFLALANPGNPAADQPVACGTTYIVASGDTLTALAARAYGNAQLASAIFAANAEILHNPNVLSIGVRLLVPCLDPNLPHTLQSAVGNESSDTIAGQLSQPTGSIAPAIAPSPPKINAPALRALTVGDFPPFAGEALTEGGLIPDLVRRAIGAADDDREVIVGFVDDRKAHLENMLPGGAFDEVLHISTYRNLLFF